ncbi:unnamed protein product [Meloidogyne enterolobii]|uniref:Uncharacterized protein n=1 Tax=Meloidogyne enterolobii TaxID=390850 RepID=A0ACB0ZBY4_MELEN
MSSALKISSKTFYDILLFTKLICLLQPSVHTVVIFVFFSKIIVKNERKEADMRENWERIHWGVQLRKLL